MKTSENNSISRVIATLRYPAADKRVFHRNKKKSSALCPSSMLVLLLLLLLLLFLQSRVDLLQQWNSLHYNSLNRSLLPGPYITHSTHCGIH